METNPATNLICPFTSSMSSAADHSSLSALTYTGLKETQEWLLRPAHGQGTDSATWLEPEGVRALPQHCLAAGLLLPAKEEDAGNSIYQA